MTQILPPDDTFAAGSPAYGGIATGFLPLYLGAKFAHTAAVTSVWLPDARTFITRPIHGAYQSTDSFGIHDYNAAFHDSGTGTAAHVDSRTPSGVMFRAPFAADVVVTGTFETRALLGNVLFGDVAPRGVFARAQAGTLSGDGTADPEIRDGSCYFAAIYRKQSDSTLRYGIGKFVAGAITIIGESAAIVTTGLQFNALTTIALNVTGTALFATFSGFGSSAVTRVPTSGTITDSSVAGTGRCGFFMAADREPVVGRKHVDLCHLFAVDEGATRKIQDEFRRVSLAAAKQTTADAMGTAGSGYLSSAYYWDAGTLTGALAAPRLRRNATANRVEFNHDVTDDDVNAGRLILSHRPADNTTSQHRSIKIIVPTAPATADSAEIWTGIVLRANQAAPTDASPPTHNTNGPGPNFPGGTGYLFVVRCRHATFVQWQLHRIVNNVHFRIAELAETPTFTIFPGYGTQFTMELDCYPRNLGDPLGHVQLACRVNGTLLDMNLSASAISAGMLNPSDGVFIDNTGARIQSNPGEGFVCTNGYLRLLTVANNIDPIFEAWTQLSLTNAEVLDRDQLSVAIAGEGAATGTALDTIIAPDWPFEVEHRSHTISNEFESGHRQTMPRFVNGSGQLMRRTGYRFRKRGVREAELDALIAHWDAHNGLELPFNFTAPGDAAVKVHYVEDSLAYRMIEAGVWEVEFALESLV